MLRLPRTARPFAPAASFRSAPGHGRFISATTTRTPIAIAFDIDGVLKQGPVVLPEAVRTIRMLEGDNPWKQKVPYLFITNSGGKDEKVRAKDLSNDFQTTVSPKQVVQAHTVMQSLVDTYKDKAVLMIGGPEYPPGASRQVLEGYVVPLFLTLQLRIPASVHCSRSTGLRSAILPIR
ncbi:glycerophospholipid biosynthesis protein [Malassezia pachydermatis]